MIDNFSLGITHFLLLLTAWRLLSRPDLDADEHTGNSGATGNSGESVT